MPLMFLVACSSSQPQGEIDRIVTAFVVAFLVMGLAILGLLFIVAICSAVSYLFHGGFKKKVK